MSIGEMHRVLLLVAALAIAVAAHPAHGAPIGSPGNFVVAASVGIIEFDTTSGQQLGSLTPRIPTAFVFSGPRLYATDPSDEIVVYDAISGVELDSLAGPSTIRNAGSIAVDANGDLILLNQVSGSVSLDRFQSTGEFVGTISFLPLNDFVLAPSGMLFGTTPINSIVQIDLSNGAALTVADGLANPGPIAFLEDGSLVVRDGSGLRRFGVDGFDFGLFSSILPNDIALGADGNLYVTHATDTIMVLDGASGELLETYATPANPSSIAFRPVPEPAPVVLLALACLGMRGLLRPRPPLS